ncbi:uncharacterized protein LOC131214420 [Anopheles bellator]|uniref:uncharacterized protein LOC131214420 n=1 Tax=Anopheles bellator TaxID=139047 RepID=UPI00264A3B73|nr:uncharacterized protein LOC131214420 [Anopheles bellator]
MQFYGILVLLVSVSELFCDTKVSESTVLRRKKRFLLFTPGSNVLLTSSFGKGLVIQGPGGLALVGELDLYIPLPDFKYHASKLKLGKVAMYPPEPSKKPPSPPPPPPPAPAPAPPHDHHQDGGELTSDEVAQYLKDHPETWVPPGWGKERADWNVDHLQYSSPYWAPPRTVSRPMSPVLDRYLGSYEGGTGSGYYGWSGAQPETIYRRSIPESTVLHGVEDREEEDRERTRWLSGEAFNISQHSDWEHFHHYRDRRALFSQLEDTIGPLTGFHMKECILRSICEAKHMLPPPGRSMTLDIFRVLFSYPLKEVLDDDYSNAMRDENANCRDKYGTGCPMSLLDLIMFGRFEP